MTNCPFCGNSISIHVVTVDSNEIYHSFMRCIKCGASGPRITIGKTNTNNSVQAQKEWDNQFMLDYINTYLDDIGRLDKYEGELLPYNTGRKQVLEDIKYRMEVHEIMVCEAEL